MFVGISDGKGNKCLFPVDSISLVTDGEEKYILFREFKIEVDLIVDFTGKSFKECVEWFENE